MDRIRRSSRPAGCGSEEETSVSWMDRQRQTDTYPRQKDTICLLHVDHSVQAGGLSMGKCNANAILQVWLTSSFHLVDEVAWLLAVSDVVDSKETPISPVVSETSGFRTGSVEKSESVLLRDRGHLSVSDRFVMRTTSPLLVLFFVSVATAAKKTLCRDRDMNCYVWVARNATQCGVDSLVTENCPKACHMCGPKEIEPKYDLRRVPDNLQRIAFLIGRWRSEFGGKAVFPTIPKIAFLIGRWRSEFGGKAVFPTIPKFTYGEELDISLSKDGKGLPTLNYTAFAWDVNDMVELHQENGFITVKNGTNLVSMTTVMSNGFSAVEEGEEEGNSIKFFMRRIGRISFSRDLPVRRMIRDWILLDENHLESRLSMATITHRMMDHTSIIYTRIYP
uniref:ShKT domain-containing protein n=1 Tax=Steinernema glaseri TaxID=37863 RepID=A0A1I7XZF0_9BILA